MKLDPFDPFSIRVGKRHSTELCETDGCENIRSSKSNRCAACGRDRLAKKEAQQRRDQASA